VHAADTYASKHFTHALITLTSRGSWRHGPASSAQLAFLNKFRDEEDALRPEDVTKGQAGDMITKLKFGARGRWKDLKVKGRKRERAGKRVEDAVERRKGEVVRVGPLVG